MATATAARAPQRASRTREVLRCRVRLADGRTFAGELAPERHRSLQIGLLHEQADDEARLRSVIDALCSAAQKETMILPLHPRTRAALDRYNRRTLYHPKFRQP